MSRLAPVCLLLVALVGTASAQEPVRYGQTAPQRPVVRVVETAPGATTFEVTVDWRTPLADAVERSGGEAHRLLALAVGGRPLVSHEVTLGAAVPPAVAVVAFEGDEVARPAGLDLSAFEGAPAEVVAVGERRREMVGSLAFRLLRVEGDRLIRARRIVVRVARPPVAARLAASGDDNPHLAVDRSVLADGRWVKVPITESGVYRVDRAFLRDSLGIDEQVPLSSIGVYGTGGRILPAVAGAPRPADLREVPALVAGDALLFYAEGPQWWDWQPSAFGGGRWSHDISPFSRASYYFLRLDAPSPARIGGAGFPGWPDASPVGRIEDRRFHEVDLANIERDDSGSGLDWFGPLLDQGGSSLTRLDVALPGADASAPVTYRARVAAAASPSVTIQMLKGGQVLDSGRPALVTPSSNGNLANDAILTAETTLGSGLAVAFRVSGGRAGAEAWLDWVEAVTLRPATAGADRFLSFPTPGGQTGRFEFALSGFAAEPQVWDVTDPGAIRRLGVQASGSQFRVQVEAADSLRPREIVAFDPSGPAIKTPLGVAEAGRDRIMPAAQAVPNQNLHGLGGFPNYVVVVHPDFRAAAERLAAHRQADGLVPLVVTTEQVFNEFAGGTGDMRAVRDFMKFLYDRAPSTQLPQYLLLFGDGHFNYRRIGNLAAGNDEPPGVSFVPPFETENMVSRTASYTTDDYFGLLGDEEGEFEYFSSTSQRVDVGVGRLPVRTAAEAGTVVDKILRYESAATRGEWRTRFTFVADDQYPNTWDDDLHVLNADETAKLAEAVDPSVTLRKIYGPAYPSVITARGRIRPQLTADVRESIEEGTLVWNYSGHGGPSGLGDEDYMTPEIVASLDNADRLPVFVTATCSFGKFDIAHEQSLAEQILLRSGGGGVAMFTTVRLVYTSSNPDAALNFGLNLELTDQMLQRDAQGRPSRLGDALYRTKNTAIGASNNNRKFNLLGDPAMRLGLPERGVDVSVPDQFEAFSEATVSGQVLGLDGQPDPTYRGEVTVSVYDAERLVVLPADACCHTDDDGDGRGDYTSRVDQIYSGRASVRGGTFSTTFLVPQDVSYSGLRTRVVAYVRGEDGSDGVGQSTEARVATTAGPRPDDGAGPEISLFLNDSTFVDGGPTGPQGVLVARLQDASGINTVGAGVGHELLVTLDGDAQNAVDVGRFYEGDLDTYRSGTVRVPLASLNGGEPLAPGEHTATLTAFDALNNASTATVTFVVVDEGLIVRSVLPYPNPTAGPSRFFVEHNQPVGTPARVQLRIYTLAGRPVRTIDGEEALPGRFLSDRTIQIPWDGLDDDADRLGSGVYLVRLRLETDDPAGGTRVAERVERLAVIR